MTKQLYSSTPLLRRFSFMKTALVLLLFFSTLAAQAENIWVSRTSAADNDWTSVTYGNGLFVAVASTGTGNRVMTSPDGITWTSRSSASDNMWNSVTFGNGLFVAVAADGTGNRVMTSPDGINWTSRTSAEDKNWSSVTYANGLFVAVSSSLYGTRVMTSPDGINWTSRTSEDYIMLSSVTYGNGLFVAVAANNLDNNKRVMTSTDGINWTSQTSGTSSYWNGITYSNGLFIAVSQYSSNSRVMTSPDGITWTPRTAPNGQWRSITYGNGLFVAVSVNGTGNRVMTSPDGITWSYMTSAADNNWANITYGNGMFVAVANTGTGNRVMTWGSVPTVIAPTAQPTKLLFSTSGTNPYNIVLKYNASATAEKYLVVRKSASAPTFVPADGTEYAIGAQGTDQIVYAGADTTVTELNSTAGSYFYTIYAYNGSSTTTKYLTTAPLVGNTHLSSSNSQTLTASAGQTTAANFPAAGVNINFDNGTTGTSLMVSKTESAPEANFSGLPNIKGVVNMYFTIQSYSPVPGVYTITLDFSSLNLTQAQWAKFKVLKRNDATKAWADVTTLGGTIVNRQTDGVWGKITVSGLSSFSQFSGGLEATTYTVTSALESEATSGTLKNRIANAEAGDFITFDVTAMGGNKIMLTSPVVVDKNLTIIGAAGGIILDGSTTSRVMQIGDAVVARLEYLKIQNGYDDVAYAGGVWNNGNLTMVNCVVADNVSDASEGTGGIVQYSAETDNQNDVLNLVNCTVTNNNGASTFDDGLGGLGIYGGVANVYNTIIHGNTGTAATDVSPSSTLAKAYNSCIGNLSAITVTTGSGNIISNPKFVGATTNATHPYSLYGNSPCVNTGSNAYSFDSKDIRNETRIQNTTIDMGAYEWTSGVDNNGTTTAIGNGNKHNVQIYSANQKIVISGAENAQVTVYNQLGQQLFAGKITNGLINKSFAKGIYIVKVNNEVQKVFVR